MSKVKFIHLRHFEPQMAESVIHPRGGVTIAFTELSPVEVRWAVARCHEDDLFIKSQGRIKAAGRLKSPTQSVTTQVASVRDFMTTLYDEWYVGNRLWNPQNA